MDKVRKRSFAASVSHRDFRYLLIAFAVSKTGDWLYGVALLVFVFDKTHSLVSTSYAKETQRATSSW
jgi:hypothetical protein